MRSQHVQLSTSQGMLAVRVPLWRLVVEVWLLGRGADGGPIMSRYHLLQILLALIDMPEVRRPCGRRADGHYGMHSSC
jgi:hypothetical protein